jgi:hypothetical protein
LVEQAGQALALAWHAPYLAHFDEAVSEADGFFSATVLCALTSRVTVDGLVSILLAMARAESRLRIPDSMTSRFSLLKCFPFLLGMMHPLSARRGKRMHGL